MYKKKLKINIKKKSTICFQVLTLFRTFKFEWSLIARGDKCASSGNRFVTGPDNYQHADYPKGQSRNQTFTVNFLSRYNFGQGTKSSDFHE